MQSENIEQPRRRARNKRTNSGLLADIRSAAGEEDSSDDAQASDSQDDIGASPADVAGMKADLDAESSDQSAGALVQSQAQVRLASEVHLPYPRCRWTHL